MTRDVALAAAAGETRATKELVRRLAPRVVRSVHVVMGSAHPDADDAVQLSLIGLIQALPAFRGDCEPEHYATRIAVRTAVATRRRSATRNARQGAAGELEALPCGAPRPSDEAIAGQVRSLVRALLDKLPEEQAETLALRVALGLSLEEVAAATDAPVNTVRSRLRLAKDALRRRIEANPELLAAIGEGP